jgi:hypothetical protein
MNSVQDLVKSLKDRQETLRVYEDELIERFRDRLKIPSDLYEKEVFAGNLFMDYVLKSRFVSDLRIEGFNECLASEFLSRMYWPIVCKLRNEVTDERNRKLAEWRKHHDLG